jgi:hypothetical protein|tara:strand:- start:1 stop:435 length:435 start_codon:yes stop_codon:yes gene_type:complete
MVIASVIHGTLVADALYIRLTEIPDAVAYSAFDRRVPTWITMATPIREHAAMPSTSRHGTIVPFPRAMAAAFSGHFVTIPMTWPTAASRTIFGFAALSTVTRVTYPFAHVKIADSMASTTGRTKNFWIRAVQATPRTATTAAAG